MLSKFVFTRIGLQVAAALAISFTAAAAFADSVQGPITIGTISGGTATRSVTYTAVGQSGNQLLIPGFNMGPGVKLTSVDLAITSNVTGSIATWKNKSGQIVNSTVTTTTGIELFDANAGGLGL